MYLNQDVVKIKNKKNVIYDVSTMQCRSNLCKKICYFYDVHKEYVDMENQKKINLKLTQ